MGDNKVLTVSSSPHLVEPSTSMKVMLEVAIGMLPALVMAVYLFGKPVALVVASCVVAALVTELVFNAVRRREQTVLDCSVLVTALILSLSLPPGLPWWMAVIGTVVAVTVGKMLFGGLGSNVFNPAMVGRAFLMACFGLAMTNWTAPSHFVFSEDTCGLCAVCGGAVQSVEAEAEAEVKTCATPLAEAKQVIKDAHNEDKAAKDKAKAATINAKWRSMFLGDVGGSVGETSALCWLIGGLFLLWRRTITYHVPLAVLGSAGAIATIAWLTNGDVYANPMVHLCGGGLMMCAFFIATDPVTCPLSKYGRVLFGIGVGSLVMLIRLKGGYPEGVMYAVLLMNSVTPLLDRWTRPKPLGGHVNAG